MVFFPRPYSCDVSGDGGNTFTAATVTKNVPGFASLSLAKAQDFPLEVQMPAYVVDPVILSAFSLDLMRSRLANCEWINGIL